VSPIFQPNLSASFLPIAQPRWSASSAWYWSGGTWNSGYMAKKGSSSTAMFGKKLLQSVVEDESLSSALPSFFAGREPPNQFVIATRATPGTDWILAP
jgi:hypothetical protein